MTDEKKTMSYDYTDQGSVRLSSYDYLRTLPTGDLEALREAERSLTAQPGNTFEMIGRILQDRKGEET